jgi:hypothetical protein
MKGYGIFTYANGDIYYGTWNNDKKDGFGTYISKSGDKYEGQYKNGVYHGKGVYELVNGESFQGSWKDGKKHGEGILFYTNGNILKGLWKDGREHQVELIKKKMELIEYKEETKEENINMMNVVLHRDLKKEFSIDNMRNMMDKLKNLNFK